MLHVQGVSVNDQLRVASSEGKTDKVLELLEAGASFDVDDEGRTCLYLSAQFGHADTVAALILAGCNVNKADYTGHTPLQRASAEGHVDIVQQLLKHGARVDHQDEVHGNTALHEAAWKGYSYTLEALCKAKANVYIKNKGGFAPLHLACQNGHNQSCRVLLLAGCKPDIKNNYGDTPLHTSARYGHAGVMRILISGLCKVSEPNKNSDTALHISVAMGRRKLTRILLEAKCNVAIQNKQGETALEIAKRKDFAEIQSILLNPSTARIPVKSSTEKSHKKREKDSGTSSKESGHKHRDKHKKSKKGHKVHFPDKPELPKWSPYGCHFYPNITNFPPPKLDSLPKEPLTKGEQYYLDLSGNIRKGPVGTGYACYCAPFFQHVEQKLEVDKQELIDHIDLARADLQERMANLEKRTKGRLVNLSQLVQEKLATEQVENWERSERRALKDREVLEKQQESNVLKIRSELHSFVGNKIKEFERKHYCHHNPRDMASRSFMVTKDKKSVKRSKSVEFLSERAKSVTPPQHTQVHFDDEDDPKHLYHLNGSANHLEEIDPRRYYLSQSQGSRKGLEADFDAGPQGSQDSGYNAAQGNVPEYEACNYSLNATVDEEDVPEFKMTGQFFDTVSNEMEKWYERRLVAIERKAEEKLLVNNEEIQERIQAIEEQLTKINDSLSHSSASRSGSSLV